MLTNVMFTTTIAELVRALTTNTILMISNSFLFLKAIVWMCLFPTHVEISPRDFASSSGPPIVVASIVVISAAFFVIVARIVLARISSYCHRRRRGHTKQEEPFAIAEKKKSMVIPPITITCRHRSDCRCLCRPQQKRFVIPHVPDGFKRVLVPTPGAKCGAREYIIAHDLHQQQQHPCSPVKPLRPKSSKLHPTALDSIPEVPTGFTRVLVPVPGAKCGERDYIVVCDHHGELLDQDGDVVMNTTDNPPPGEDPKKNKSRRIGMREKVLPFELHEQIIEYSYAHMNWTMSLVRDYPPEFFLYAREITRKYNFFHGTEGDCASRLGCGIWTIAEEDDKMENLESLDESTYPTEGQHGSDEGREGSDSSAAGSDTFVVEYDEQEEDVVCNAVTAVAATTLIVSSKPSGGPEDGTHVFAADSSCNGDLSIGVVKNHDVAMLQQGSGYYVDDKGRKRRFSLRILAKKNQQGGGPKKTE